MFFKDKNYTLFHYVPAQFVLTPLLNMLQLYSGKQEFDENHQKFMK